MTGGSDEVFGNRVDREVGGPAAVPGPRSAPALETVGPGSERPDGLVGPAWLLRDVTHVPGVLRLRGDRLRFVSTRRVVLDATPEALGLTLPRTRRGPYGLVVDGEHVGLSVVRPPGAVPVPTDLLAREGSSPSPGGRPDAAERWYALLAPLAVPRPRPVRRALSALAPTRTRPEALPSSEVSSGSGLRAV